MTSCCWNCTGFWTCATIFFFQFIVLDMLHPMSPSGCYVIGILSFAMHLWQRICWITNSLGQSGQSVVADTCQYLYPFIHSFFSSLLPFFPPSVVFNSLLPSCLVSLYYFSYALPLLLLPKRKTPWLTSQSKVLVILTSEEGAGSWYHSSWPSWTRTTLTNITQRHIDVDG